VYVTKDKFEILDVAGKVIATSTKEESARRRRLSSFNDAYDGFQQERSNDEDEQCGKDQIMCSDGNTCATEASMCPNAKTPFETCIDTKICKDMDLAGKDFSGLKLMEHDFTGANLKGAIFTNAELSDNIVPISAANLNHADLSGANLEGAFMGGISIFGAIFANANLKYADMGKLGERGYASYPPSKFESVNFDGAQFNFADLRNVRIMKCSFIKAVFNNNDFTASEFRNNSQSNFSGAQFSHVDLRGVVFGYEMKNGEPVGSSFQGASFQAATKLSGTKFQHSDLREATFDEWTEYDTTTDFCSAKIDVPDLFRPAGLEEFYEISSNSNGLKGMCNCISCNVDEFIPKDYTAAHSDYKCKGPVCQQEECCVKKPRCGDKANEDLCPDTHYMKDPDTICDGKECTPEMCCEPKPKCGENFLDEGSTCGETMMTKDPDTICDGNECTPEMCCEPNPTCDSTTCPAGQMLKTAADTIKCAAMTCTSDECCDMTCGTFSCPAGNPLKQAADTISCAAMTCTPDECCDSSTGGMPTTTTMTCGTFSCPAGQMVKPAAETISCAAMTCMSTECCDMTCASYTGCLATAFQTLKPTPDTIKCAAMTCTSDECCNTSN